LGRDSSNWQRVKQDGVRALDAQLYNRVAAACQAVGLLINPEGELEGFCRMVPSSRKSEWLSEVMKKDFSKDSTLTDARSFSETIRMTTREVISRGF
jgi:hypothetical protein